MKYRFFAWFLVFGFVGGSTIHGYVTTLNQNGVNNRWFLATPNFLVPGNSVNKNTKAIRIYLHEDAFSEANRESELNAVRAAFGQWQGIPESSIKFEEAGFVSGEVDINTSDATNLVYWAKSSTSVNLVNGQLTDIRGRLGVTFKSGFVEFPIIAESDIVFNGVEQEWYTDFTTKDDPRQFVEGVALHEIGHLLGLAHSTIGASTMIFDSGGSGVGTVVGLSKDDIAYADQAYGSPQHLATKGTVTGVITKDGVPVYGASILLEDDTGAIVTGGISRQESGQGPEGHYIIKGVPPGNYHLRVHPLQAQAAFEWLIVPGVIPLPNIEDVDTSFLPSTNTPITVTANQTTTLDVQVQAGEPPFLITGLRSPTTNGFLFTLARSGVSLRQGDQDFVVGVYGTDLPTEGSSLTITGPGVTITPVEVKADLFPGLVHLFALASVADDAPPGLRSFVLRKGPQVAYAPGYIEILPKTLDYNFDGLSDGFQRRHFDPFTSAAALPGADPDNDGFTNAEEATLDSNPNDPNSFPVAPIEVEPFEVLSVVLDANGSRVTFASVEGATYQLFSRKNLRTGTWEPVGEEVTAEGALTEILDPTATEEFEFYQVESVP